MRGVFVVYIQWNRTHRIRDWWRRINQSAGDDWDYWRDVKGIF